MGLSVKLFTVRGAFPSLYSTTSKVSLWPLERKAWLKPFVTRRGERTVTVSLASACAVRPKSLANWVLRLIVLVSAPVV